MNQTSEFKRWMLFGILAVMAQLLLSYKFIGTSAFLKDQVDQIYQIERLLSGDLNALYGPFMSGTDPQAFNFGPTSALIFGSLSHLLSSPFQMHLMFAVLLALSSLFFLGKVRTAGAKCFGMIWFGMCIISPIYWWHFSLLWANALLLPFCFFYFGILVHMLRKPTFNSWIYLFSVNFIGMHIHSTPISLLPITLAMFAIVYKDPSPNFKVGKGATLAAFFAFGPYLIAEISNNFSNTAALLQYLGHSQTTKGDSRSEVLARLLQLALDPIASGSIVVKIFAATVLITGLVFFLRKVSRRNSLSFEIEDTLYFLCLCAALTSGSFLWLVNRPILSHHYLTVPFYALSCLYAYPVFKFSLIFQKGSRFFLLWAKPFYFILIGLLIVQTHTKFWKKSDWTYSAIKEGLRNVCLHAPTLRIDEWGAFGIYVPGTPGVLTYVVEKEQMPCILQDKANWVLRPQISGKLPDKIELTGERYLLKKSFAPNFGLYR